MSKADPSPIESFKAAMSIAEQDPDNVDVQTLYVMVKNYVEQMIGMRRLDETQDAYKVRVFANLIERDKCCIGVMCPGELILYAREATDSGDKDTARRWYSRMIGDTLDPVSWALYGAFCVRQCEMDAAIECTRTAIAVDGHNRLALFVHVATLMTARTEAKPAVELDELRTALETLTSRHPRFSQGHMLAALHFRRMDMPEHTANSLAAARLSVNDREDDDNEGNNDYSWLKLLPTVWEPIHHEGDPTTKCAVLLVKLDLARLAMACLLCFGSDQKGSFHLLMAVSHHTIGEYGESVDHLNSIGLSTSHQFNSRQTLMMAHNNYKAGNITEAMVQYIGLLLRPTRSRYCLAYTRTGDYFANRDRPAEAVEAYYRACTAVSPTPMLMTKMGACLFALNRFDEAEKALAEAIAVDGADNGRPWYHLADLHKRCGRPGLAEFCYQRASELGYQPVVTTFRS